MISTRPFDTRSAVAKPGDVEHLARALLGGDRLAGSRVGDEIAERVQTELHPARVPPTDDHGVLVEQKRHAGGLPFRTLDSVSS
jgi:hypothetical protein